MSSCVVLVLPFIVHGRAVIDEPSAFDGTDADNCSALMRVIALLCSKAYREQLQLRLNLYLHE